MGPPSSLGEESLQILARGGEPQAPGLGEERSKPGPARGSRAWKWWSRKPCRRDKARPAAAGTLHLASLCTADPPAKGQVPKGHVTDPER